MAPESIELDVRRIPPRERHAKIFAAFDGLAVDGELHLTSDHEPRPLRAQFDERRAGGFIWVQRMIAGDLWRATIRRIHAEDEGVAAFLRRCAVFADLSEPTLRSLVAAATERTLARDEAVAEEGSSWDAFGVVMRGTIVAVRTSQLGREHGLYDVLPAEVFGEVALLDGGVTLARYAAGSAHATVLLLPKEAIFEAMGREPALARTLAVIAVQRLRAIIERFTAQTSLPTISRVASVLLPHAGPQPGLQPALATLKGVTQNQMAVAAGTVKEVVSRALMELEQAGAIERKGGRIVKVDRAKLEAESAGARTSG
ncbi:MAG: DUF2249 domain-containing protein [Candidatus Eremiobacteraeota bacterium]|nr:DUF2249 domain-containing protein [Candidatus Eremiobacteraeota bacterium]